MQGNHTSKCLISLILDLCIFQDYRILIVCPPPPPPSCDINIYSTCQALPTLPPPQFPFSEPPEEGPVRKTGRRGVSTAAGSLPHPRPQLCVQAGLFSQIFLAFLICTPFYTFSLIVRAIHAHYKGRKGPQAKHDPPFCSPPPAMLAFPLSLAWADLVPLRAFEDCCSLYLQLLPLPSPTLSPGYGRNTTSSWKPSMPSSPFRFRVVPLPYDAIACALHCTCHNHH